MKKILANTLYYISRALFYAGWALIAVLYFTLFWLIGAGLAKDLHFTDNTTTAMWISPLVLIILLVGGFVGFAIVITIFERLGEWVRKNK